MLRLKRVLIKSTITLILKSTFTNVNIKDVTIVLMGLLTLKSVESAILDGLIETADVIEMFLWLF